MTNPVVTLCGHTFDKEGLEKTLAINMLCPICRTELDPDNPFSPNFNLKTTIEQFNTRIKDKDKDYKATMQQSKQKENELMQRLREVEAEKDILEKDRAEREQEAKREAELRQKEEDEKRNKLEELKLQEQEKAEALERQEKEKAEELERIKQKEKRRQKRKIINEEEEDEEPDFQKPVLRSSIIVDQNKEDKQVWKKLIQLQEYLTGKRKKEIEDFRKVLPAKKAVSGKASVTSSIWGIIPWGSYDRGDLVCDATRFTFLDCRGTDIDSLIWSGSDTHQDTGKVQLVAIKEIGVTSPRLKFSKITMDKLSAAMKRTAPQTRSSDKITVLREAMILSKLNHPHIVSLKGIFQGLNREHPGLYIVMPLAACDLEFCVHLQGWKDAETAVKLARIERIMLQVVTALCYLHSAGIVHRDISSSSVLINWNEKIQAKLCSFGHAQSLYSKIDPLPNNNEAYYGFRAPELILCSGKVQAGIAEDARYWKAGDVWSAGCLLAWMLRGGKSLFSGIGEDNMLTSFLRIADIRDSMDKMTELFPQLTTGQCIKKPATADLQEEILRARFLPPQSVTTANRTRLWIHLTRKMLQFDFCKRITFFESLCHPAFYKSRPSIMALSAKHWHFFGDDKIFLNRRIDEFYSSNCEGLRL